MRSDTVDRLVQKITRTIREELGSTDKGECCPPEASGCRPRIVVCICGDGHDATGCCE